MRQSYLYLISARRRRTFSLEDSKLHKKCEAGTLKKSRKSFSNLFAVMHRVSFECIILVSSTIRTHALSSISNCHLTDCDSDYLDSLDKEIENLCPFVPNAVLKVANNSRYCDIFSRQSMESDENSSADDEIGNFLETVQHSTCDILQLIPKKPVIPSESTEIYQPIQATTIQLKPSSFSAFRELSEVKHMKPFLEDDNSSVVEHDDKQPLSECQLDSHDFLTEGDPHWMNFSWRYLNLKTLFLKHGKMNIFGPSRFEKFRGRKIGHFRNRIRKLGPRRLWEHVPAFHDFISMSSYTIHRWQTCFVM